MFLLVGKIKFLWQTSSVMHLCNVIRYRVERHFEFHSRRDVVVVIFVATKERTVCIIAIFYSQPEQASILFALFLPLHIVSYTKKKKKRTKREKKKRKKNIIHKVAK